jgi:hypothetical protein
MLGQLGAAGHGVFSTLTVANRSGNAQLSVCDKAAHYYSKDFGI